MAIRTGDQPQLQPAQFKRLEPALQIPQEGGRTPAARANRKEEAVLEWF